MKTNKLLSLGTGLALAASLALAIPAFAQTNPPGTQPAGVPRGQGYGQGGRSGGPGGWTGDTNRPAGTMRPGVSGTVTALNGNIISVNGRQGFGSTTPTVAYSVDATNATVRKNNATSTVSAIAVGDTVFAQGTVTGTNVVATSIFDGMMGRGGGRGMGTPGSGIRPGSNKSGTASSTVQVLGNGQPVVAGTISAISGNTLTLTTTSNVTYTIDATNAKILEGNSTVAIGSLAVGNKVLVQGTVSGTSVTASTVIDQSVPAGASAGGSATVGKGQSRGFFSSIGQFFSHIFGF